jgi:glutathione synthase/RimK-type ligase-like ATP-grasp enzyme
VTYAGVDGTEDPDIDVPIALPTLRERGLTVDLVRWDDPGVRWVDYRLALVRSTWDYTEHYADFLTWIRRVDAATRIRNPLATLEANTDKRYLRTLADAGVPIVPTSWIESPADLAATRLERIPSVVKPAVSAGARDTVLAVDETAMRSQAEHILALGKPAMVQPYLAAVEHEGEIAVIVLGDQISHAVRKVPPLTEGGHGDPSRPVALDDELRGFADRVLSVVPDRDQLVYARVDVVRDENGQLVLMELELTEPLLFLGYDEGAPARFADAVVAALS